VKENTEDDAVAKRKEARRKSLANRRVSFAPEATLHTWDVIEYMRDATTSSSASSELEPQPSTATQASFKSPEPETSITSTDAGASKSPSTPPKQRQDSAEPESSPGSQRAIHQKKMRRRSSGIPPPNFDDPQGGSAFSDPESPIKPTETNADTGHLVDLGDDTVQTVGSPNSTSSSARLDAALKQATLYAGTHNIRSTRDTTTDPDDDAIVGAFKPWTGKNARDSIGIQKLASMRDQENVDPFRSPPRESPSPTTEADDHMTQDMSMDMTAAVGGILRGPSKTVELNRTSRRRRSSTALGTATNSTGSPFQRPSSRRSLSRRTSIAEESSFGDESMDLTTVIGGIQNDVRLQNSQDREDSPEDQTMDFTLAVGGIKGTSQTESQVESLLDTNLLEDMSMELTENIGRTLNPPTPITPSPKRRTRASVGLALPPTVTVERPTTPRKSPRKSPTKSMSPASAKKATPLQKSPRSRRPSLHQDLRRSEPLVTVERTLEAKVETAISQKIVNIANEETVSLAAAQSATDDQPTQRTMSLADSLKMLSTPRKGIIPSPALNPPALVVPKLESPKKLATPMKSATPKRSHPVQRSPSPRKRVRLDVKSPIAAVQLAAEQMGDEDESQVDAISLQDFLSVTNIRFMDLTTTKRRATGHPGADNRFLPASELAGEDQEPSLENNVGAAIEILPMLSMYRHTCQEMKSYINSVKTDVHNLEEEVLEYQPPLFQEYFGASAAEKSIMNAQLRDLKTNARLQSKAGWHNWRSQLLNNVISGTQDTALELENDSIVLAKVEKSFEDVLPALIEKSQALEEELAMLEKRKADAEGGSGAELDEAREQLQLAEREIEEQDALLASLKAELEEKKSLADDARSWRAETIASINEADRVCEEYRGWSTSEVTALQGRILHSHPGRIR
jgi:kinetochore protein Spc7/SPC105